MVRAWFFCLEGFCRVQVSPFINASTPLVVVLSKRPYRQSPSVGRDHLINGPRLVLLFGRFLSLSRLSFRQRFKTVCGRFVKTTLPTELSVGRDHLINGPRLVLLFGRFLSPPSLSFRQRFKTVRGRFVKTTLPTEPFRG